MNFITQLELHSQATRLYDLANHKTLRNEHTGLLPSMARYSKRLLLEGSHFKPVETLHLEEKPSLPRFGLRSSRFIRHY